MTDWFEQRRDYAPIFIRLFAGVFLIYMSQDNVFSWERMLEFEKFLRQFGFPLPLVSAVVSVALLALALLFRRDEKSEPDMGSVSRSWTIEYNASHGKDSGTG